jgi:uncharacterized protein YndB with AHSA1/START domain
MLVMEHDDEFPPERMFEAWTRVDPLRLWFGCAPDKLWNATPGTHAMAV